jgi:Tfp pilus assembly protein PilF
MPSDQPAKKAQPKKQGLAPPDSMHLSAAVGWLELGNWQEANEELEKVTPQLRAHPDVLSVRWHVYTKAKKWDRAAEIARALVQLCPKEPQFWILGSQSRSIKVNQAC